MLRRSFLKGLGATLFVAPSIVRADSLMKVKEYMPAVPEWCPEGWLPCDGRTIKQKFYPDLYKAYTKMRYHLALSDQGEFMTYSGFEVPGAYRGRAVRQIISYKDLKRANGSIVQAGVKHDLVLPDGYYSEEANIQHRFWE